MPETDHVTVGRAFPKIARVVAVPPTSVAVTWAEGSRDGRSEVVDLAPMLLTLKLYKPLRDDPDAFARVRVAAFGYSIAWDDEEAIDMSSAAIEELAQQKMEAVDFKAFLARHGLTLDAAAAVLGLGRRIVAYYSSGQRQVPRVVALACAYLDADRAARSVANDQPIIKGTTSCVGPSGIGTDWIFTGSHQCLSSGDQPVIFVPHKGYPPDWSKRAATHPPGDTTKKPLLASGVASGSLMVWYHDDIFRR